MRRKLLSLVVTLVTLFVGSSSVSAYDWTGNAMETGKEFYLYNVGFKSFLAANGDLKSNPEDASKWVVSGTEGEYAVMSGKYGIYFAIGANCGVDDNYDNAITGETIAKKYHFIIDAHSAAYPDAYKFYYHYQVTNEDRYFNVQNSNGAFTDATTLAESDAWLFITQEQVDEYEKELEAWEGFVPGDGDSFYLYNPYTGKYLQDGDKLTDIDGATKYTYVNEPTRVPIIGTVIANHYRIKYGDKYVGHSNGSNDGSATDFSFVQTSGGMRIGPSLVIGSSRYLYAADGTWEPNPEEIVNFPRNDANNYNIRRSYWVCISEEEYNIRKSLTITIPESGYTTYSNKLTGVKLVDSHYTAYASTGVTENDLYFTTISAMPSEEGAFVKGTPGTWRLARAKDAAANEVNYLKAGDNATHEGAYVLASATDFPLGFYLLNSSVAVPEGKAYLVAPNSSAKGFVLDAANIEQATAISAVIEEGNTTDAYSVMGTKVGSNYKGIVIKNGKKFFQK